MKIGIDMHALSGLMQGSRTYIHELTRELLRSNDSDLFHLYLPEDSPDAKNFTESKNCCLKTIPKTRTKRLIGFRSTLKRDKVDIFHCQYLAPPFLPCPYVLTLHDIIHESSPQFYPRKLRSMMSLLYPRSARMAAAILTVSEYSRSEIIKRYNIPEERVHVTPNGISAAFKADLSPAIVSRVTQKYGISGSYIFFVGRIEPRKNLKGLIEAFGILSGNENFNHTLVIAGMMDPIYEEFHLKTVREFGNKVLFTGKIEQEDLPYLYHGAALFVYPSFAEGFGLPPLEAMGCGTPVITSNTTSLPEVTGDAAILVDPFDTDALAKRMKQVLGSKDLQQEMIYKGLKQSQKFRWEQTAKMTLNIYKEISGQ